MNKQLYFGRFFFYFYRITFNFEQFPKRSHEKELGRSSGWIFLDAANELFKNARLRVYGTNMANKNILIKNNRQHLIFNKSDKGTYYSTFVLN
jgi:hypothetical protein